MISDSSEPSFFKLSSFELYRGELFVKVVILLLVLHVFKALEYF